MSKTRYVLSNGASFWVSAAVVAHTLWTSAAPSMTYPLYASMWGLTPFTTTAIFAIYPIVVVAILILFGNLSDYIGRRKILLAGLAFSIVGVLLFAVAPDVTWLFVGRAFMGVGVGLSAGPSAAAMVEFSAPGQSQKAGAVTTAAQAGGLILAGLLGGGLIQYAPFPTRLNFIVLLVALLAIFAATWFLPHHTPVEAQGKWRPRAISIPSSLRWVFASATVAVTASYVLGSITLSLGAQIAHDVVGSTNTLVNGATFAIFSIAVAIVAIKAKSVNAAFAIVLGGALSIAAVALLTLSAMQHSLFLFFGSAILSGVAYSFIFTGGLTLLNAKAPPHHRGGTLSALFLVAYLTQGLEVLLLGHIATISGLVTAIELASSLVAILSVFAILLTVAQARFSVGAASVGSSER